MLGWLHEGGKQTLRPANPRNSQLATRHECQIMKSHLDPLRCTLDSDKGHIFVHCAYKYGVEYFDCRIN